MSDINNKQSINPDEIQEIRQANPWLDLFDLSDQEISLLSVLITRVVIGSDSLDTFYKKLSDQIKKDEKTTKKIFLVIAKNKLLKLDGQIGDVKGFIEKMGGSIPSLPKDNSNIGHQSSYKPLNSVKPQVSISFSREDDEEIRKIVENENNTLSPKSRDYNSLADAIISELGYNLESDVLEKRLQNIIVSRLKDVRDELETVEILKKSKKIGGLDMDDAMANKVVGIARSKIHQGLVNPETPSADTSSSPSISFPTKQPFRPTKRVNLIAKKEKELKLQSAQEEVNKLSQDVNKSSVPPKPQSKPDVSNDKLPTIKEEGGLPVITSPQGDDLIVVQKQKTNNTKSDTVKVLDKSIEDIIKNSSRIEKSSQPSEVRPAPAPDPVKQTPVVPPQLTEKPKPESSITEQKPIPQPMMAKSVKPKVAQRSRPSLDGVGPAPTLVGPVEELGTMTLINFRRLGQTPQEIISKIKEKVDLLEQESYAKRLEGIDAWHRSEVTRFYRLLGQESMKQSRSVDDIISDRIKDNKPTLSIAEFNSIMELNRQLRY